LVKGAKYVHDFEASDHERLAKLLGRFRRSRVVVSYYDHPSLADLYPGWTQRKIVVSKALSVQGQRGGTAKKATEVLLLNGPSYAKPEAPSLFHNP
jgi:DNA adenine methylase